MRLELDGDRRRFRERVREFAAAVVAPRAADVDHRHRFPEESVRGASELGLMGLLVPPQYGGAGRDHLDFVVCVEELARACASTAVIVDVHASVATEPILLFGTVEQRRRWLPLLARGDVLGAFALTEPQSGSDAAALRTRAERRRDGWVLSGTKVFITNVGRAGLYLVFARTGGERAAGISAFLVPGDAPGLRVGQVFDKMGLNGSPTGELVLEEVALGSDALLGEEGKGFQVAMRALDSGRIGISGQALGIATAALEAGLQVSCATEQGSSFELADMATRLEAGRLLARYAAWRCDRGLTFTREASMAKLFCTDTAMEVASGALALAPPQATEGSVLERCFRDAKALQIYEGSNQVQRIVIARRLLGEGGRGSG
jgi:alkylation response protein AidB-like acyl-CoA dehydrogenase